MYNCFVDSTVYYDVNVDEDVTIRISLGNVNFNRMWEIKVSVKIRRSCVPERHFWHDTYFSQYYYRSLTWSIRNGRRKVAFSNSKASMEPYRRWITGSTVGIWLTRITLFVYDKKRVRRRRQTITFFSFSAKRWVRRIGFTTQCVP